MAWSRRRAADASSAPRAPGGDPELATWLNENGMPRFAGYSWREHLPVLTKVLFVVLAFELAILPWLVRVGTEGPGLTATHLAVAPAFLAAVALAVQVGLRKVARAGPIGSLRWLPMPVIAVLALVLAANVVLPGIPAEFLWSDYTVDALIVYLLLSASWRFAYGGRPTEAVPLGRKRWLLFLVTAAIVLIALEHTFFPAWSGAASLGGLPLPQGTVALGVALVLLVLTRARRAESEVAGPPTRAWDRFLPAVPLLIFVLTVEAAVLPYVSSRRQQLVLPLLGLGIVLGVTSWRGGGGPGLVALLDVRLDVGGGQVWNRWQAALFVLGVNLACLVLAVFLAALALEKIAQWALREFRARASEIIAGVLAHAPVILVFAAFFLFTAETWEIAVEAERGHAWEFWALVGGLLATSVGLLVVDTKRSIRRARRFTAARMRAVLDGAADTGLTPLPSGMFKRLAERMPAGPQETRLELKGLRRVNIYIVIGAYQALIFVPLLIFAGVVFWVLAEISVAPMVAATWIRGDGAGPADAASLKHETAFLDYPWLRVALLLAVFALLERVVRIITEPEQRAAVLGRAEAALQVRLAAALLLDRASTTEAGVGASPAPIGDGQRGGPARAARPVVLRALVRVRASADGRAR
jgi:hypothetical protein